MKRHTSRSKNPRLIAAIAAFCFAAGVTAPVVTIVVAAPAAHASIVADSPDCGDCGPNG
jgi:hypothetical protein